MTVPDYSLSWILPFVRQSLRGRSNFSYDNFVWPLWQELEKAGIPGIVKTPPEMAHTLLPYDYAKAPYDIRIAASEAFHYLLHNGFIIPEPPHSPPVTLSLGRYMLTKRGSAWVESVDALPEDYDGYLNLVRKLVPNLDSVIEQYVSEGLSSFVRGTYFAAAVMIGAAAEKAFYLLAESMVDAFKDAGRQSKLKKLLGERKLNSLFRFVEEAIDSAHTNKVIPYTVAEGTSPHLMSLIEAIRVQRNDAVHPMNAQVSADSVRHSFNAFPHALARLEALRAWFLANPKTI